MVRSDRTENQCWGVNWFGLNDGHSGRNSHISPGRGQFTTGGGCTHLVPPWPLQTGAALGNSM